MNPGFPVERLVAVANMDLSLKTIAIPKGLKLETAFVEKEPVRVMCRFVEVAVFLTVTGFNNHDDG
jgi:hypothetical protein